MKRPLPLTALSLTALITLSACGSSSGGTMEGMDMAQESSAAPTAGSGAGASSGAPDEASTEHNDADVLFAQMMIPHHRQAVEMSGMILAKDGLEPQVTGLATTIRNAQDPEIETMTGWLGAWGEPLESEDGMKGHDMGDMGGSGTMNGMMSEDRMAELASADGPDASRLFLESMTAHHEGAIGMAQDQLDDGRYPEALELAATIVETQQAEIDAMEQVLAAL
ncbi:hypothetical protein ASF21_06260 [Arthrobacter sp. Leaf234]|uniref:DUF305 domain-containing protein n=1 Tax=Arthrobacter sp. Leaf234 TaxID=1736303 RepID=UPI0006FFCAD3|nr:DUF305 domain-containing protein [Arthrobacter sp. Leaf234]KQO03831.1 hypothetical protein ASF21_06260 [Arthrobacter sp. Leaf234]